MKKMFTIRLAEDDEGFAHDAVGKSNEQRETWSLKLFLVRASSKE